MEIGIWRDVKKTSEKSKDGHFLYSATCKFCSKHFKMKLSDIKRAKICTHKTNGIKNKRISQIFNQMFYRCYNERNKDFNSYGKRGIKIFSEWIKNPKSFEDWALNNGYSEDLTIDRIDVNGDYCPENCRWITFGENAKYKRSTKIIEVDGIKKTGRDWSKELGFSANRINIYRNKYGYENTVNFIRKSIQFGVPKLNGKESYYEKIMEMR